MGYFVVNNRYGVQTTLRSGFDRPGWVSALGLKEEDCPVEEGDGEGGDEELGAAADTVDVGVPTDVELGEERKDRREE